MSKTTIGHLQMIPLVFSQKLQPNEDFDDNPTLLSATVLYFYRSSHPFFYNEFRNVNMISPKGRAMDKLRIVPLQLYRLSPLEFYRPLNL